MVFYLLYRLGYVGCRLLPLKLCYWLACRMADLYSGWATRDREGVRSNLAAILEEENVPPSKVREVFRNFALYLVDFFRFGNLTLEEIRRRVRIEGFDRLEAVLTAGRGAIGLTAHLGNYELGGAVISLLGVKTHAVVLVHQNPRVDAFFARQRARVGVKGLPVHSLDHRSCVESSISVLRRNEFLALVGDRDFFQGGVELPLFGRTIRVPRGPALLSLKTGSPIVPIFVVREGKRDYRVVVEPPIPIPQGIPRDEAMLQITRDGLNVMARYIRQYPTQWYVFQEFWGPVPAVIR